MKKQGVILRDIEDTVVPLFKTTHGTKKMWSYDAGGLKIEVV